MKLQNSFIVEVELNNSDSCHTSYNYHSAPQWSRSAVVYWRYVSYCRRGMSDAVSQCEQ